MNAKWSSPAVTNISPTANAEYQNDFSRDLRNLAITMILEVDQALRMAARE